MDGPRVLETAEFPKFLDFLNTNLRPESAWSIAEEYPGAISTANMAHIRAYDLNGDIVSAVVTRVQLVKSPFGYLRVGLIGSVVTHPKHRGQGYSQSLLKQAIEDLRNMGCDLAMLWTDSYDFYRKLGFELAGYEVTVFVDRPLVGAQVGPISGVDGAAAATSGSTSDPSRANPKNLFTGAVSSDVLSHSLVTDLKFTQGPKVSPEAILKLYSSHTCGSLRSAADIQKSLRIPSARIYTAWQGSEIKAFAVEGKGADLQGYIHEWGGGVSSLVPLVEYMRQVQGPLTWMMPYHAQHLRRRLSTYGLVEHFGYLGMLNILNPDGLVAKANRYLRSLGAHQLSFVLVSATQVALKSETETLTLNGLGDFAKLLFGPNHVVEYRQAGANFSDEFIEKWEAVLPFPFWIWGWDSI